MSMIVEQYPQLHLPHGSLVSLFKGCDVNGDGSVSRREVIQYFKDIQWHDKLGDNPDKVINAAWAAVSSH